MAGFLALVIALALLFGVTNGVIDGGSLVATVISTRALEPFGALMLVASCELAGMFLLGQAVAHTLAVETIKLPPSAHALPVLAVLVAALFGALVWNTGMWRMALPTSSSHALVGGLLGAVLCAYGIHGVMWPMVLKILLFLIAVPLAGAFLSFLLARLTYAVGASLTPSSGIVFRFFQILALAGVALAHGSNDGQKSMAMIWLAVLAVGVGSHASIGLLWLLRAVCGLALALGVVFGSRGVVGTLGKRLYRVQPLQGFCAESSSMLGIGLCCWLGYPASTTHMMSMSVLGAGVAVHPGSVRWCLVGEIAMAWLLTIPAAGVMAAGVMWLLQRGVF